jgi:asparagine synthase (glutamine-hydrolysing)
MSIQFGRWNFAGQPVETKYVETVRSMLAPYGPDGASHYTKDSATVLYHAFHTTSEARTEQQPFVTSSGAVMTWDGRLDNRSELLALLHGSLMSVSPDISIVAAAYERWGTGCFSKLVGDWALVIWAGETRSLYLAKDVIGTRQLYYSIEGTQVTWSTILDPLVLLAGRTFSLNEEYVAGWFSFFPAADLTPYIGIHSVPPAAFVQMGAQECFVRKYWDFDPARRIRYNRDAEYEEHFRSVFREAVRRRLRSDRPILAELSGGVDSSSIVCMADQLMATGAAETPQLDTVSYFNDREPHWNERPFFAKVEERRGRKGCHIDVGTEDALRLRFQSNRFEATPGAAECENDASRQFAAYVSTQGSRVILSGIGGDETTGGVPTAVPELADLLASGQFRRLAHGLKVWSLHQRRPWFHLFFEVVRRFLPPELIGPPRFRSPAPWLHADFVKRNRRVLDGYESRLRFLGPWPSFLDNLSTLEGLRRQLACDTLSAELLCEKRYPYLDRDFLEFLYAIPRDQLVRPGQRRSLMRRALTGIVPPEILDRKRKAYIVRASIVALSAGWDAVAALSRNMVGNSLGIFDEKLFAETLEKACCGEEVQMTTVIRTLGVESWFRNLRKSRVVTDFQTDSTVLIGGNRSQLRHTNKKGGEQDEIREAQGRLCQEGCRSDSGTEDQRITA